MGEAEKIDKAEQRKRAKSRLARSRPARAAAAAAHADRIGGRYGSAKPVEATKANGVPN